MILYHVTVKTLAHLLNGFAIDRVLTMEYCIQNRVLAGSEYRDVQAQLKQNDDNLFCWSVLTASWSDYIATTILDMIIDLWIVIQGFSMLQGDPEEDDSKVKSS